MYDMRKMETRLQHRDMHRDMFVPSHRKRYQKRAVPTQKKKNSKGNGGGAKHALAKTELLLKNLNSHKAALDLRMCEIQYS